MPEQVKGYRLSLSDRMEIFQKGVSMEDLLSLWPIALVIIVTILVKKRKSNNGNLD